MRFAKPRNASTALVEQFIAASTWIVFSFTVAAAAAAQVADRNALAEPCRIASLEEAQAVLGVPTKPRWHHRWTSKTDVRTACDFMTDGAPPTVLRVIKIEFANESLARDYLTPPAHEAHNSKGGATDEGHESRDGMFAEVFGRKANIVVSLTVFPGRYNDRTNTQASEAQFKRLLELRQQVLGRLQ